MKSPPSSAATWLGPACGLASAVLYTLTNIALRDCVSLDAYLVSAVKAGPTVVVLGPLVSWMLITKTSDSVAAVPDKFATSRRTFLAGGSMSRFVLASFLAQFLGNAAFQKALERIGLAASVPITLGVLIVGGAALGVIILKEPVSQRKVLAMMTLIVAVVVLSLPRQESSVIGQTPIAPIEVVIGSLWAATSGLAYSFFGVTMRQTIQAGGRSSTLMFVSGLTGTITLWSYCFAMLGAPVIAKTTLSQWGTMIAAGFFNFSAFIAITAALRLLPVVAVNLINASQVAMAAIAGVILFDEPVTVPLVSGILLTLVGLVILAGRTRATVVITD